MMAFVIDAGEWSFDGWTGERVAGALELFLERVGTALERGERVWVGDTLQTRAVLKGLDLWRLWSPESPVVLSHEMLQELSAYLGRLPRYLDVEEWPPGFESGWVAVGDGPMVENEDVAWVHHAVLSGRALACLGLTRNGVHSTTTSGGSAAVRWVVDEPGHRSFFRDEMAKLFVGAEQLAAAAAHAFPDLHFLESTWRGCEDFDGGYGRVREELLRSLAVLDDHGRWIFKASPPALVEADACGDGDQRPPTQLLQQRFSARRVAASPEHADVVRDRRCREARERLLKSRLLFLEWHVKLEPHANRMYFHPPVPESGDRVVVGIFHRHLPLPGDD